MPTASSRRAALLRVSPATWAIIGVVLCLLAAAPEPRQKSVKMIIDYGDGAELHFPALKWRKEMTVLDAVKASSRLPHGVNFTTRGSGTYTFVTGIDDVENEGGGSQKRNWIYRVNGKKAEVSVGAYRLQPADVVLWKFEPHD